MKLRNLFYALLAVPMVFVACDEAPIDEPTGPQNPGGDDQEEAVLTLTSEATMEFAAAGGEGEITFTLENAEENAKVDVSCDSIWVLVNDPAESVTFTVEANDGEAREAKVTVSYKTKSFEVTVKQAAKGEDPKPAVPELVRTSEEVMNFDCTMQEGIITYTLANPIQGQDVKAKANVDWISSFIVRDSEISFVVAANAGEAREGKITVEYGILNFEVAVKQSKYVVPAPVIVLSQNSMEFAPEGGDCSITYTIENPVEGVELAVSEDADWITDAVALDGQFYCYVAANETSAMREATITFTYGDVTKEFTVKQLFAGYDPNMEYVVFGGEKGIVDAWAELGDAGKKWSLVFVEHDTVMGDMQTFIALNLPEANTRRPESGTYSVANGGILLNSERNNSNSSYRRNCSLATDITDATFEVTIDTRREAIVVEGTFQAGNTIVSLKYAGPMRGMDLAEDAGSSHYTEWKALNKNYQDTMQSIFTAKSQDSKLEIMFSLYHTGETMVVPEGTYNVDAFPYEGKDIIADDSKITYNGVMARLYVEKGGSGYVTVEHISGGYKITFELTDELGRTFTGVIERKLNYGENPA